MTDTDRAAFDPFAAAPPAGFAADRWQRAGATEAEITALSIAFAGSSLTARQGEVDAIAAHSDYELIEAVAAQRQTGDWVGFTGSGVPVTIRVTTSEDDETPADAPESGPDGGDDDPPPDAPIEAPAATVPDVGNADPSGQAPPVAG